MRDGAQGLAGRIAEQAAETWYSRHGSDRPEIPLSVIAALAISGKNAGPAARRRWWVASADDVDVVLSLQHTWARFWVTRPDLACHTGPLTGWLLGRQPLPPVLARAAPAVARAVVRAGLPELTAGAGAHLHDVDLLGTVYQRLRPGRARQARGEFYTPAGPSELLASVLLGGDPAALQPGQQFCEPAAGTGGLLRAAAEQLRRHGTSPAACTWAANDVSPVTAAALAVNCYLWDLGPHVVIGCADTITDPLWPQEAASRQAAAVTEMATHLANARLIAAARGAGTPRGARLADRDSPARLTAPRGRSDPSGPPLTSRGQVPAGGRAALRGGASRTPCGGRGTVRRRGP